MAGAKHSMRENLHKRQMGQLYGKKSLVLTAIVCASFPSCLSAQPTRIPITPKPVGSGARALGQSAFIAVVDDATAASWNPAGLINLERPEVSFVGAWRSVDEVHSTANPRVSIFPQSWSDSEINFMSYAHPCVLGNTDVVLSVNYHQVYDFGSDFNTYETMPTFSGEIVEHEKGKSEGAVSAHTLAGGLSMPDYPEVTVGIGVNWYTQSLLNDYAWQVEKTRTVTMYSGSVQSDLGKLTATETFDDFRAHNLTLGLLWDAYEKRENLLTFGLVYHTPFTASADRELDITSAGGSSPSVESMDIDFPASLGAGMNYRFSDSLSAAFDVEWKEWSKFTQKYADGREISPVGDDTLAYRLGGEHLFLKGAKESVFACRGGAFYEPRPVAGYPDSVPVYGFSAGLGWTLREQFSLDFAYQYRWGEEELENFDYSIKEQFLVASLIRYF